jgi:hypothetical protein
MTHAWSPRIYPALADTQGVTVCHFDEERVAHTAQPCIAAGAVLLL